MSPLVAAELQQKLFRRMGISTIPEKRSLAAVSSRAYSHAPKRRRKPPRKKGIGSRTRPSSEEACTGNRETRSAFSKSSPGRRSSPSRREETPLNSAANRSGCHAELSDSDSFHLEEESSGADSDDDRFCDDPSLLQDMSATGAGAQNLLLQKQLARDEAEIQDFERKLNIRKGRKSLPQAFKEDGLDDLVNLVDVEVAPHDDASPLKRKTEFDAWLSSKRRKSSPGNTSSLKSNASLGDQTGTTLDTLEEGLELQFQSDLAHDDLLGSTGGLDGCFNERPGPVVGTAERSPSSARENPYVAPIHGTAVAKYVPPSKRHCAGEVRDPKSHLHKRIQGLVNRLTDTNLLSIVKSIEEVYQSNSRAEVTEILTGVILAQMRKPESLPDQFFVLVGGFSASIYKVIGSSFGAHLIRQVVEEFSAQYDHASDQTNGHFGIRKEPSNFLAFLTQLYVFEVVGSNLLFDYMEKLLPSLSELDVELLLRICRMAGKLLRRDGPRALKHICGVLNAAIAKIGYTNVPARTRFMIETIQGLRNGKSKAKGVDSAVISEHALRMKKRLGELKSQTRRLDGLTPMGVRLKDFEGMDKHGKWWLVGASVPKYRDAAQRAETKCSLTKSADNDESDDEDMDIVLPDYARKARAQGFSTSAQIAIFTAVMSALDYEHGYRQFVNLKLKKDEQLELSRVLVQCTGSEQKYNQYYALLAKQACSSGRMRFSFQDRLWKIFRSLGESLFGEDIGDDDSLEGDRMKNKRRLRNVAQFYASLVADGVLSINLLKPVDLHRMKPWTSLFVEWFLLNLLRACKTRGIDDTTSIERMFALARNSPALAAGLRL